MHVPYILQACLFCLCVLKGVCTGPVGGNVTFKSLLVFFFRLEAAHLRIIIRNTV